MLSPSSSFNCEWIISSCFFGALFLCWDKHNTYTPTCYRLPAMVWQFLNTRPSARWFKLPASSSPRPRKNGTPLPVMKTFTSGKMKRRERDLQCSEMLLYLWLRTKRRTNKLLLPNKSAYFLKFHNQWESKYSSYLNTEHMNTGFIWIPDSMGVWYSNGKVTWIGRQ